MGREKTVGKKLNKRIYSLRSFFIALNSVVKSLKSQRQSPAIVCLFICLRAENEQKFKFFTCYYYDYYAVALANWFNAQLWPLNHRIRNAKMPNKKTIATKYAIIPAICRLDRKKS